MTLNVFIRSRESIMNRIRLSDYNFDLYDLFHYERIRLEYEKNTLNYLFYNYSKVFTKKKFRAQIEVARDAEGVNKLNFLN
jgi:hypothetical protein